MIQYCMMHTLHLGLFHHVNGGCLLCLMNYDFFGTLILFDLTLFLFPKKKRECVRADIFGEVEYTKNHTKLRASIFHGTCDTPSWQPSFPGPKASKLGDQLETLTIRFRHWLQVNSILTLAWGVHFRVYEKNRFVCICSPQR